MIKLHTTRPLIYARSSNEQAFTLIEALFSLMIFSIIVYLIAPIIQISLESTKADSTLQAMEWEVFSNQIKQEIRTSTQAEVLYGKLYLTKDAETVTYDKYGTSIRRRVNSAGHEIVLQNISQITFNRIDNTVEIEITDVYGNNYDVTAYGFVDWKPPS